MMSKRHITRDDILAMDAYEAQRPERRRRVTEIKRHRRVAVGPDVTFYFENYETMLHQIHEMLRIEKGGEAQIEDELSAYNPLIPDGRTLVATMMIEIEDPVRRSRVLGELGGIDTLVALEFDGQRVAAVPEEDVERTTEGGKTSSVHFLKFPFTDAQIAAFRTGGLRAVLGIDHPRYAHMAVLSDDTRTALGEDFN